MEVKSQGLWIPPLGLRVLLYFIIGVRRITHPLVPWRWDCPTILVPSADKLSLTLDDCYRMTSVFDAYDVRYAGSKDGAEVYEGKVDPKWSIGR